jgi:hypothetical protein
MTNFNRKVDQSTANIAIGTTATQTEPPGLSNSAATADINLKLHPAGHITQSEQQNNGRRTEQFLAHNTFSFKQYFYVFAKSIISRPLLGSVLLVRSLLSVFRWGTLAPNRVVAEDSVMDQKRTGESRQSAARTPNTLGLHK